MSNVLLECRNLKKYFKTPAGMLHAVDDISFSLDRGKTLGVVGESGCGKSTLGRTVLRLLPATEGEVFFEGKNIFAYDKAQVKQMRREMQIIFQDPYSSLNPKMTVAQAILEPLRIHGASKKEADDRLYELMDVVGLARRYANTYPHELDGGRRQRIGIACALALNPKFIVCDEPVSALDVSIQAQILNLMMDLKDSMGLTYMFITHDLSVVKHISDEIAVLYLGQMIEKATPKELFSNPLHPYTQALLAAIPVPDLSYKGVSVGSIKGEISSPIDPGAGCRFAPRCPMCRTECAQTQKLVEASPGHWVACQFCGTHATNE